MAVKDVFAAMRAIDLPKAAEILGGSIFGKPIGPFPNHKISDIDAFISVFETYVNTAREKQLEPSKPLKPLGGRARADAEYFLRMFSCTDGLRDRFGNAVTYLLENSCAVEVDEQTKTELRSVVEKKTEQHELDMQWITAKMQLALGKCGPRKNAGNK